MRQKLSLLRILVMAMLLVTGLLAWNISAPTARASAAATPVACAPSGTTYGTDTLNVAIPAGAGGTAYTIWSRVQVPSTPSAAPLLLNIDGATGTNCYNVGSTSITANTWTWVSSGSLVLAQGNHSFVYTGIQSGVSLDRIEVLSDSTCTPTGNGDNCTPTADTTPPTATVTAPANGATVSGTTTITATANDDSGTVSKVEFYNGATLLATDTTGPSYTFSWNTTSVSNGSHVITAKAYDPSNNIGTSTAVTVTVNNAATCGTGTLAPPTGLTKGTVTYTTVPLSWTAPAPTTACSITGYKIFRDGSQIGSPTTTTFTDTALPAGSSHNYTVEAVDSGPNTSLQSATLSVTTVADNVAPKAPSALSATVINASQINLSWTNNGDMPIPGGVGVGGYNVYRCTGTSCTPTTTSTPINTNTLISGTSYSDTTVSSSTSYRYIVTAVDNNSNESASSNIAGPVTTPAPPPTCTGNPTQPGNPTAGTTTVNSVSFSWSKSTASAGCTLSGYHIYQVNGSTYNLVSSATITGTTTLTATINGLTPNLSYTYAVEAFDTSGHSSDKTQAAAHITIPTLPDTSAPTSPSPVTATSTNPVSLTWSASTDDVAVTGYKIYRCSGNACSNFSLLTTVNGAGTRNYSDSVVSPSTSYTYQVSALDGAGNESAKASAGQITTPGAAGNPPSAPTSVTPSLPTQQQVQLGWQAPSTGTTPTGYHVYLKVTINGTPTDIFVTDTATTAFTDTCLEPGITYTYDIKAFNAGGVSSGSSTQVTTQPGVKGNVNCSGLKVGIDDVGIIFGHWLQTALPSQGDVNNNGTADIVDIGIVFGNYGKNAP